MDDGAWCRALERECFEGEDEDEACAAFEELCLDEDEGDEWDDWEG